MENYVILLVDDEVGHKAIIAALLAPHDIAVEWAADLGDAIRLIRETEPRLILLDPGAEEVRRLPALRNLVDCPIVAFTAEKSRDGENFDGWLPRPFDAATVLELVADLLRHPEINVPPVGGDAKLAELLGEEAAAGMFDRLHTGFAEAIAAIDGGEDPEPFGHRLGGLAGLMGYSALSAGWLALQDSRGVWPTVRAMTVEARAQYAGA